MKRWALVLIVSLPLPSAPAADSKAVYLINLSPPAVVGEMFEYKASESQAAEIDAIKAGKNSLISNQSSMLQFTSLVEVTTCDHRGMPSSVILTIKRLRSPLRAGDLIEPETVLTARPALMQADPPKYVDLFSRNDQPIFPTQANALRRVITIGSETESTEQQAFGTDKPLPVGGSWVLNGEPGARLFAKMHIAADPKNVTGTAELVGVNPHNDIDCLEVHMAVRCTSYKPAMPLGQTVNSATAQGYLTYYIAKDTGRVVESTYKARTDIEVRIKSGADVHTERHLFDIGRTIEISKPAK